MYVMIAVFFVCYDSYCFMYVTIVMLCMLCWLCSIAVVTDNTAAVTDVQFTPLLTSKTKDEQFMGMNKREQYENQCKQCHSNINNITETMNNITTI